MKVRLFVDAVNMYFSVREYYASSLDYEKLLDYVTGLGDLVGADVYGLSRSVESLKFRDKLKYLGYRLHQIKAGSQVNQCNTITADIALTISECDVIVVVSGDGKLAPIIQRAKAKGKHVIILGIQISGELRKYCPDTTIELPREMCRPIRNAKTSG